MTSPSGRRTSHRRPMPRLLIAKVVLGAALTVSLIAVLAPMAVYRVGGGDEATSTAGRGSSASGAVKPTAGAPSAAASPVAGSTTLDRRWLQVLDEISERRANAWRQGDAGLLRGVFVPGSAELAADTQMLHGYLRRGLLVSGVHVRFLAVEVQSQQPGSVTLLVVDRLGPAVAHDSAGDVQRLPHDLPSRHQIELRQVDTQWRIARVIPWR
jgi:hypothetical protein